VAYVKRGVHAGQSLLGDGPKFAMLFLKVVMALYMRFEFRSLNYGNKTHNKSAVIAQLASSEIDGNI